MNAKIIIAIGLIGLVTNPLNVQAGNDKQPLRDMTILDVDDVSDEEYEESKEIVNEAYEKLPEYAKEMLNETEVYLTDDTTLADMWFESVSGEKSDHEISSGFAHGHNQMVIETKNSNSKLEKKEAITGRFYHEVGTDLYLEVYYGGKEYIYNDAVVLYEKELEQLKNTDFYSTFYPDNNEFLYHSTDYLCTSIACYMICPQELKDNCPETYGFVDTMVREYCELKGYTFVEPVLEEGEEPKVPDTSEVIEDEVLVEVEEPEVIEETTAVELEPVEEIETEENIVEEPKKDSNMFPIVGGIAGVVVLGGAIGLGMKKKK